MPVKRSKTFGLALILMLWAFGTLLSLPFMSWKVEYARAEDLTVVNQPKVELTKQETILEKINRIALAHNLKPEHLAQVIACESRFDPMAHNKAAREDSWGLVQQNRMAHKVSIEDATNPDKAITYLAKNWKQRHLLWVTCSKGL